ncbi:Plastid lipid-associated protein/fibrillin conserved domain-containing protein [Cynara cardunculus var. scolymus]|uniref:Plastid lipid-associated protein/fibrillin conserved domain-containing protein n=1 Tax=Cynara cardunculus var. scolymus TaxID=59895 RepID=A0A103Y3D4_CYNCS|nr:Plastid lipid-associated protein/fibrillin conserved domain-containing protein [Cynara cardunculus var. scolymus]
MALSTPSTAITTPHHLPKLSHSHSHSHSVITFPAKLTTTTTTTTTTTNHHLISHNSKWRTSVSFFTGFLNKPKNVESIKQELLDAIAPLDRGAEASPEDQQSIEQIVRKLEAANPTKEPLKSPLLDGKWELLYTTSQSILQTKVTADLTPLNAKKVAVKFDYFKIAGLIPVKAPDTARGSLEITYLDEGLRVSRGDKGNLFILRMIDPSYRVPV